MIRADALRCLSYDVPLPTTGGRHASERAAGNGARDSREIQNYRRVVSLIEKGPWGLARRRLDN
jgi:hypothetical protein